MRILVVWVLLAGYQAAVAQDIPSFKFGRIKAEEISTRVYPIDSNASAVIIADIGSSKVKGNSKGWFSLEFKFYRRIHILKKSAFDWATIEIQLYTDGENVEELDDVKAVTYNVENGKVVETELNAKSAVFKEKLDKNTVLKRFTLPNVKEGSVIEYSYTVTSDFLFNIQPWNFQGEIPRLWSEYTVSLPPFMNYMLIQQISRPYHLSDAKEKAEIYLVDAKRDIGPAITKTDRFNISCMVTNYRWGMKDVPAFRAEAYTSSPMNHIERLEFQLAGYQEPLTVQKILTTWPDMTERLMKRDDFGATLKSAASYWPVELEQEVKTAKSETMIANRIFSYIRDHFTCTDYSQLYLQDPLKKIAERKAGGVAEINLLLTAFLKHAGLQADPVILSSRGHMFVNDRYPVASRFNYVITRVFADGKEYLLDASRPLMGFGKLHYACFNGNARVVDATAALVSLQPDMNTELSRTNVILSMAGNGKWTGIINKQCGYFYSEEVRQKMRNDKNEEMLKTLTALYSNTVSITDLTADSLRNLEEPVTLHYVLGFESDTGTRIYINPVLGGTLKQNPFKSSERKYPVEMPYRHNELYSLSMELPAGLSVDELPKPVTYKMNAQGDAVFEYKISQSGQYLNMQYRLEVKRANFTRWEYDLLRNFFGMVVSKLEEQIVLKKN
ncbi:MAG TPA: DUF3857 domain-containing protein [Chitinophagaceae bacterium]|nr:DUF3857 domain-containing protein [Chitinophagaceae bacterium]